MTKHDDSMSIRAVVRAVTCLDDVLRIYGIDAAKRLCIVSHYQSELIEREINLSESTGASAQPRQAGSAPGPDTAAEAGGRFKITALTDKGKEKLPDVIRLLGRI